MNTSDSSSHFITRRDFMKKSALTVGAITLLSQGIGLAAGSGSSNEYWDMNCSAPVVGSEITSNAKRLNLTALTGPLDFELILESLKVADPGSHYNYCAFTHDFSLTVSYGGQQTVSSYYNSYEATCDVNTGAISTMYDAYASDPQGGGSVAGTGIVGPYMYSFTISITRVAGGSSAQTQVFAEVSWSNVNDPNDSGTFTLPPNGAVLSMVTSFVAHKH